VTWVNLSVIRAAAVERMRRLGNPKAEWYAHHLAAYRSGAAGAALAAPAKESVGPAPPGAVRLTSRTAPSAEAEPAGPGVRPRALTATTAMAAFLGSGFKAAPPEIYRARLAACTDCAHHTGVRRRICGCITVAKARLLHERCPAGRWPSRSGGGPSPQGPAKAICAHRWRKRP
jgi:hypothetical protein